MAAPEHRTTEKPAQERRNEARRRILKRAHIAFKGHVVTIDCVVRNLSDRGACLNVESPLGIPDTFDLVIGPRIRPQLPRDLADSYANRR